MRLLVTIMTRWLSAMVVDWVLDCLGAWWRGGLA